MKRIGMALVSLLIGLLLIAESGWTVQRVSPRWSYFEIGGFAGSPIGDYPRLTIIDFLDINDVPRSLDAKDIFKETGGLRIGFGRMVNNRLSVGLAFRYTAVPVFDSFLVTAPAGDVIYSFEPAKPKFNLYDLVLDVNVYPVALQGGGESAAAPIFSPFIGLGFSGGVLAQTLEGFEAEYEASAAVGLNFGADIRLGGGSRQYVTLSSVNSWIFAGSTERPRHLQIGASLKVFGKL